MGVQRAQPAVADALIFSERALQRFRHFEVRILDGLELLDQRFETAVPRRVNILRSLHHFVEIEGTVGRDMHLSGDKFLWGNMERFHHFHELSNGFIVVQLEEIAVFQGDEFFLLFVAIQYIEELFGGEIARSDRDIEQIALYRETNVEFRAVPDLQGFEAVRHAHFAALQDFGNTAVKQVKCKLRVFRREQNSVRRIIVGKVAEQKFQHASLSL